VPYPVLAPWVVHSTYVFVNRNGRERNLPKFLIFPFLLRRIDPNQIWITVSRYRNAGGNGRIVDKGIDFEQVDREPDWSVSSSHITIFFSIPQQHLFLFCATGIRKIIKDRLLLCATLFFGVSSTITRGTTTRIYRVDNINKKRKMKRALTLIHGYISFCARMSHHAN